VDTFMHVKVLTNDVNKKLGEQIGYSASKIEGRQEKVRKEETNLGNLIADLIRSEFNADFAISNGGGLRADNVFKEGPIKFSFLAKVVPITEKVVKGSLTGRNLKQIMEHGLSNASSLDGRWPVISGFRIKFDPT